MVVRGGYQLGADIGKDLLIDIASREVGLEPRISVLVLVVVRQTRRLLILVILIISRPDDNRRVMAQKLDVFLGLALDRLEHLGMGWVIAASEHEVLPDENAVLVTGIVECLVLVYPAAPYANHELVAVGDELHPVVVSLPTNPGEEIVCRDPIGAAAVDRNVVDAEEKRGARLVVQFPLDELCTA